MPMSSCWGVLGSCLGSHDSPQTKETEKFLTASSTARKSTSFNTCQFQRHGKPGSGSRTMDTSVQNEEFIRPVGRVFTCIGLMTPEEPNPGGR